MGPKCADASHAGFRLPNGPARARCLNSLCCNPAIRIERVRDTMGLRRDQTRTAKPVESWPSM